MMLKWQVRLCHKFIVATTPHTIFPPSPQSNVDKTLWTDIHVWMYFSTLQQWKEERGFRYILTSCWNQNSKQLRVSTICDKACSFDKIKRLKLVNSVFQPLIITNISQLSYKLNKLLPAIWSGLNDSSTTLSPCHFLTRLTVQFFIQWQVEEALQDQKQERESRKRYRETNRRPWSVCLIVDLKSLIAVINYFSCWMRLSWTLWFVSCEHWSINNWLLFPCWGK